VKKEERKGKERKGKEEENPISSFGKKPTFTYNLYIFVVPIATHWLSQ
jgi:hypothetical protein